MSERPPLRDGLLAAAGGLAARLAVVLWASGRVPPAADGTFYDVIARRIAEGQGYTWRWPDGTITYAAHYPVGYPALVAFSYRLLGAVPRSAMLAGALLGALGVLAVHRLVARGGSRRQAIAGAVMMALHPGLVSYTPALMTEGVTASLVALALYTFARARDVDGRARLLRSVPLGVVVALATYVRPQCIVLAPMLALLLPVPLRGLASRAKALLPAAIVATAVALALVAPWTARNCDRMGRCAMVSVNGGWNLLIGTDPDANGSWAEVKVPVECRSVFDEAKKDACFGEAARREIVRHPLPWLALVPKKVAATFDYAGAGPWYLHAASPAAFSSGAKVVLGAIELVFERLTVVLAIVAVARAVARRRSTASRVVRALMWASTLALVTVHGSVAVVGLTIGLGFVALSSDAEEPPALGGAFVVLGSTLVIHAVFFGAGRYSLVTFPAVVALAAHAFPPERRSAFDSSATARAS